MLGVVHPLFNGGRAFIVLGPQGFGIEGHAVFEPHMIAVRRRNIRFPPLPRDLIGQDVRVHILRDRPRRQKNQTRARNSRWARRRLFQSSVRLA